ncbi:MAG: autotransporter domain-containing protein [Burkholderiaceae bacterium]|nr:autotransporter domain-containing protein [Burkholderiaceae bacterium]
MQSPQKKLIALAVLSVLAGSGWAAEVTLHSKDLVLSDMASQSSQLIYIDQTSILSPPVMTVIAADSPTVLRYTPTDSSAPTDFTAIYSEGEILFKNHPLIVIETMGMDSTVGLDAYQSTISADGLSLQVQAADGTATALTTDNTSLDLNGQFVLSALHNGALGTALDAYDSTLTFTSTGNSLIKGHINVDGGNVCVNLKNPTDTWIGRTEGDFHLTITGGAQWTTDEDSNLAQFKWGKDGVLDIREKGTYEVRIVAGETIIEDGAVLKVDLASALNSQTVSDLYLSDIQNTEEARVNVDAIDTTQSGNEMRIELAGNGANLVFLEGASNETENALYRIESTTKVEQDQNSSHGWIVKGIDSKVTGTSTMMNQMLDFFGTNTIAHEQMTDRSVARSIDRSISNPKTNGYWVDVSYGETDLHFADNTRHQTMKTTGLEMGYDRTVTLPYLNDGFFSVSANVARSDITIDRADGDIDQWGLNVYAGGITSDNYRLLLGAHYQQGQSELTSNAFLGDQSATFKFDRELWAASAYLGFVHPSFADSVWHLEPFMMGTAYWIKTDDSESHGVRVASEKLQQSVVRLGANVGFKSDAYPLTLNAKAAWAHRFGRSVTITGTHNALSGAFETEALKESWAELTLAGQWQTPQGYVISLRGQMAKSHDVEPQFEVGLNMKFPF